MSPIEPLEFRRLLELGSAYFRVIDRPHFAFLR